MLRRFSVTYAEEHGQIPTLNGIPQRPNRFLIDQNKKADIVSTLELSVTTSDDVDGGIVNIPFIRQYADAKSLESTFWVETVKVPQRHDQRTEFTMLVHTT